MDPCREPQQRGRLAIVAGHDTSILIMCLLRVSVRRSLNRVPLKPLTLLEPESRFGDKQFKF